MAQLEDIYPDLLRMHYEQPHNCVVLEDASATGSASNPLCGDELSVYLKNEGDKVAKVTFQGHLCAVATASASMMSEAVKNKSLEEVAQIREAFAGMMRGRDSASLGDLDALQSVRRYRVRVRCALLPWQALLEACNAL
ncbi:MAG TPA: SUF system NifU family Fe-S cluster assembly protein [Candidatus Binataceae bacterium]|nr:SUF system NifU family Fe-S cluster assembly protein [Candidatus Binataceae bacterium]